MRIRPIKWDMDEELLLTPDGLPNTERHWPIDARAAMYTLEVAGSEDQYKNRRRLQRLACRLKATLANSDDPNTEQKFEIYLRDLNPKFAGFIVNRRLAKGELLFLRTEDALPLEATVRILRCRPFMDDWCECSAAFADEQAQLATKAA